MISASSMLATLGTLLIGSSPSQLFTDQTESQLVQFSHESLSGDEVHMGAGACWGDFDNDGWPDLYVANQIGPNALFWNLGEGTGFAEVAAQWGVALPDSNSSGVLWGDYDNDGDQDLFVMARGRNTMFRNDGQDGADGWRFTDVTDAVGVGSQLDRRTSCAVYGDYDNDGWLDLFVGTHHLPTTLPVDEDALDPSHADSLYHNGEGSDGQRVFVDVAYEVFGVDNLEAGLAHSAGFLDYDNDRDLDLFVVNEHFSKVDALLGNQLWRNDGAGTSGALIFTEVSEATNVVLLENPMGLAIGDYNNDGWLDMATSDFGPNHLYRNTAYGSFVDVAQQAGVAREYLPSGLRQSSWGLAFLDYDLDGYEDLYVATGQTSEPGFQFNPLFHNNGDETFTDVTEISGADLQSTSRCVTVCDYDRDGDLDFYVVTWDHDAHLFRNEQVGGSYLALDLTGSISNRDAIGARVRVTAAGLPDQHRMVQSGSTTNGGHEHTLYLGTTGTNHVDAIEIDWPSGLTTVLEQVAVNQRLKIQEPVPTAITIVGQNFMPANDISAFTAEALCDDDTKVDITGEAVWSVAPATFCEFISPGQLRTFGLSPGQTVSALVKAEFSGLEAALPVDIVDPTEVDIAAPEVIIFFEVGPTALDTDVNHIVLTGTADDESGIVSLFWSSDRGSSGPCAGINPWLTVSIQLYEGSNLITITAIDGAGNMGSATATITFTPPSEPLPTLNPDELDDPHSPDDSSSGGPPVNIGDPSSPNDNSAEDAPLNDEATPAPAPNNDNLTGPSSGVNGEPGSNRISDDDAPACGIFGLLNFGLILIGSVLMRTNSK